MRFFVLASSVFLHYDCARAHNYLTVGRTRLWFDNHFTVKNTFQNRLDSQCQIDNNCMQMSMYIYLAASGQQTLFYAHCSLLTDNDNGNGNRNRESITSVFTHSVFVCAFAYATIILVQFLFSAHSTAQSLIACELPKHSNGKWQIISGNKHSHISILKFSSFFCRLSHRIALDLSWYVCMCSTSIFLHRCR